MVVNHGFVRYGSEGESRALKADEDFAPVAAVPFLIALMLGLRWGVFHIRNGR